jgi:predicted CoA-binding protein
MTETVVVLGASARRERFANRAQRRLTEAGHRVVPVNPALDAVEGVPVTPLEALPDGSGPVDTITVYLSADRLRPLIPELARIAPRRVLLNPGADDSEMVGALREAGLKVQTDCTLVLLDQGRFERHEVR